MLPTVAVSIYDSFPLHTDIHRSAIAHSKLREVIISYTVACCLVEVLSAKYLHRKHTNFTALYLGQGYQARSEGNEFDHMQKFDPFILVHCT